MKFSILSAPRSGSHMLASALNNHTSVTCELETDSPKFLSHTAGYIANPYGCMRVDKIIWLKRDLNDCVKSLMLGSEHHKKDTKQVVRKSHLSSVDQWQHVVCSYYDKIKSIIRNREVLVLNYSQLTENENTKTLKDTALVCDFLKVVNEPLVTDYHKPIRKIHSLCNNEVKQFYNC